MNIEKQYPSPNRCKKLAKLGFPYDTEFFMRVSDKAILKGKGPSGVDYYPCPSVLEMLEVMKGDIAMNDIVNFRVRIDWLSDDWSVSFVDSEYGEHYHESFLQPILANAVADCLIWLIEKDFIYFKK